MPQNKQSRKTEGDGICQDCLEREMENWFDEGTSPELVNIVNKTFDYMLHDGTCLICGKDVFAEPYAPLNFQTGLLFDAVSEDLEFENFREETLDTGPAIFVN